MPGTTSRYAIPYSLGTDAANTIDNTSQSAAQAIDDLIGDSPAAGSLFHVAGTDTCAVETATSTTFVNRSNLQVTFTTGESGVFLLSWGGDLIASAAGTAFASVVGSGGITFAADDGNGRSIKAGTQRVGAQVTRVYNGTPNTSVTITLALKVSVGSITATFDNGFMQVVNLG